MRKSMMSILLLLMIAAAAFAQETMAVHPLDNTAETDMETILFEELVKAIPQVPNYEGVFSTYLIDLIYNRPDDVPEGGFPSYICPPLSLTQGAPYAITGEIGADPEYPDEYWVRLYLWEMESGEMMVTDMVTVYDRESAADNYPYLLEYLFSKIEDRRRVHRGTNFDDNLYYLSKIGIHSKYWLLVGAQAGAGSATWMLGDVWENLNISFAVNVVGNIFYPLSVQLEANIQGHMDMNAEEGGTPTIWSLAVPLLLRYSLFTGRFNAGVYGGHWMTFALAAPETMDVTVLPGWNSAIGVACGMSIGWELGPRGNLFLDARFYHLIDTDYTNAKARQVYPFNGFVLSVGYQVGLIEKKPK